MLFRCRYSKYRWPRCLTATFKWLGRKDFGTTEFPRIETPLIEGEIAFRQHSGGHTPAANWTTFLTLTSKRYDRQGTSESRASGELRAKLLSLEDGSTIQVGQK
jgi:hypothetical protein